MEQGTTTTDRSEPAWVLTQAQFPALIESLRVDGYAVVAPTIAADAVILAPVESVEDLPIGWTDEQDGGYYRLKHRADAAQFGHAAGPYSWKRFLHPPEIRLVDVEQRGRRFDSSSPQCEPPRFAFLGVRPCDLQAITVLDNVFLHGPYVDPTYLAQRQNAFIIAVNCTAPGGTCFCVSMDTGPCARSGFDLLLTEIVNPQSHHFLIGSGTERGQRLVSQLPCREATDSERAEAREVVDRAAAHMGRTLDTREIKELLYSNYEHPRWEAVATRCLNCANCTMVCPTCFCTNIEDVTDLAGEHAERWRKWDSCFTLGFTHITSGSVRASAMSRYRQWMTHKLATWIDQFGTSGCVGCGRCITWCPVGIDITEEAAAIRATPRGGS